MKLADKVKTELLDYITVQKKYLPGDKLPNENDLAQELGVSRTTIREAIQYLASQGVVDVKRGLGTFIAKDSCVREDFGFDALNVLHIKIKDLYELRLMVEPDMAYYAVMILALETNADLVVIDDANAKKHAKYLGLPVTGTLGILIKAKKEGSIRALKPILEEMTEKSIYLSNQLIKMCLEQVGEE